MGSLGSGSIRRSERHDLVGGQLVGLADQVVSGAQAGDQPRLLVERAPRWQHANRHGATRAVVGQTRIMALTASVLTTPELLVTSPSLEMTRQSLIQTVSVRFTDVDDRIRAIALA